MPSLLAPGLYSGLMLPKHSLFVLLTYSSTTLSTCLLRFALFLAYIVAYEPCCFV